MSLVALGGLQPSQVPSNTTAPFSIFPVGAGAEPSLWWFAAEQIGAAVIFGVVAVMLLATRTSGFILGGIGLGVGLMMALNAIGYIGFTMYGLTDTTVGIGLPLALGGAILGLAGSAIAIGSLESSGSW